MLTPRQIELLRSENELLRLQLEDVNQMISVREEELELLQLKAQEAKALKSRMDANLLEIEQMQNHLGHCQQTNEGKDELMAQLEEDLYQSVKEQQKSREQLKEFASVQANLLDTTRELDEAASVYKKLQQAKAQLAAAQSELEMARLEISNLAEQLSEARALYEMLIKRS